MKRQNKKKRILKKDDMRHRRVAILILTYNASKFLGDLFSSLEKINYPRDYFEIIFIDNHSSDDTLKKIQLFQKKINCRIISNPQNYGFAEGNNVGIRYARDHGFDDVYLLNQDTAVDPDFLLEAVRTMEQASDIAAVQSRLMYFDRREKVNSIGNCIHFLGFAYAGGNGREVTEYREMGEREIAYASGAACLLRLSALRDIGLFDRWLFMYHEDVDLGWRMWLAGYRSILSWNSVVYHKYEFSRSIKKMYYMERNRIYVLLKNYKLPTVILLLPLGIFVDIIILGMSLFNGTLRNQLRARLYFFRMSIWKRIIKQRSIIKKIRKRKDAEIFRRFTDTIEFQNNDLSAVSFLLHYGFHPMMHICWWLIRRIVFW